MRSYLWAISSGEKRFKKRENDGDVVCTLEVIWRPELRLLQWKKGEGWWHEQSIVSLYHRSREMRLGDGSLSMAGPEILVAVIYASTGWSRMMTRLSVLVLGPSEDRASDKHSSRDC